MRYMGLLGLLCVSQLAAQFPSVRLERFVGGLSQPLDISNAHDGSGRLFVLEQAGRVRIVRDGGLVPAPFLDIRSRVSCCGERGLLGIAFPPSFPGSGRFYVHYTDTSGNTVLARYQVSGNPDAADPNSETVLLRVTQPFPNHNGGQLAFGPDGFLYFGLGDGGSAGDPQGNAQNRNSLLGKILRLDVESGTAPYAIPPSNPFAQGGGRGEVWAYGLRNPWRFSFDRETGDLYIGDVGQDAYEEIDFQPASSRGGENYGWNRTEGRHCYGNASCNMTGLVQPVAEYDHRQGCSVTGGAVYRGNSFSALRGVYIYGDYCSGRIWGLRRAGDRWEESVLLTTPYLLSAFGVDEAGEMYAADIQGGAIYRVVSEQPPVTISRAVSAASFGATGLVPGSIAALFGSNLSNVQGIAAAEAFPLPTTIRGTYVTVNGVRAPLYAVANVNGAEQINFQVPPELPVTGNARVVVVNNGTESEALISTLADAQPEIFVQPDGIAAALDASGQPVTAANPLRPGQPVSIFATGLGPVDRAVASGEAARADLLSRTVSLPQVRIGGVAAQVSFSGLAPGFAGLYQINAVVPDAIAPGRAELIVQTGTRVSQGVPVPIR